MDDKRAGERRDPHARDTKAVRKAIRSELAKDTSGQAETSRNGLGAARPPVVSLANVSLAFDIPILKDISFAASAGETVAIVGESGTGKSTILKLILRLLVPDKGCVCIEGDDITKLSFDDALKVRQKMGMVFQGAALFDSMTVFENVAYPMREHTDASEEEIDRR